MSLENEKKRWDEETVKPVMAKFKERKDEFASPSGIPIPRTATPDDSEYMDQLGFPGEYPFTSRCPTDHVSQSVLDDAPVRRIRFSRGIQ